jgi:hypothetical protein
MLLLRVGYWRPLRVHCKDDADDCGLPDPRELVEATLDSEIRSRVASYLKCGRIHGYGFGYSYCRFQCGTPDRMMGSTDLTDGAWVWPEGLWHYVEVHSVRLPHKFIEHLRQRDFRHLTDAEFSDLGTLDDGQPFHTPAELYQSLKEGW